MLSRLIENGHRISRFSLRKSELPLHCMPVGAGFERRANEVYSWEGMARGPEPFILFQHTIGGRGELDYSGSRYQLLPGSTMLLSLPHRHRYWLESGQQWEHFWIALNGREALRIARELLAAHGPVLQLPAGAIDRLAAVCLALSDDGLSDPGRASALAYESMMALTDGLSEHSVALDSPAPQLVQRVASFVDSYLAEPLGVDRLAQVVGLSRAHFVRKFSAAAKASPSQFVLTRRLDRAARLLLATDLTLDKVAAATGFSNANYFSKVFRRVHGVTPTAYRLGQTAA